MTTYEEPTEPEGRVEREARRRLHGDTPHLYYCTRCGVSGGAHVTTCPTAAEPLLAALAAAVEAGRSLGLTCDDAMRAVRRMFEARSAHRDRHRRHGGNRHGPRHNRPAAGTLASADDRVIRAAPAYVEWLQPTLAVARRAWSRRSVALYMLLAFVACAALCLGAFRVQGAFDPPAPPLIVAPAVQVDLPHDMPVTEPGRPHSSWKRHHVVREEAPRVRLGDPETVVGLRASPLR
ncbi:MAG TPA: hypothetical protein VMB50_17965 [Myxococcales bacterium]|nr:hypothetical protein [Myxococcales bacterium]